MTQGVTKFRCAACGKTFMGADIELGATTLTTPLECPHCGSKRTRPWKISDNLSTLRKQNDKVYHSIWEASE